MNDVAEKSAVEAWRPVVGFEGRYEVSDLGRIRRDINARGRGAKPGRILRTNGNGRSADHRWVTLYRGRGEGSKVYVHRAVAAAFVQGDGPTVRHHDDDPTNNVPSKLAWGTQADNVHDMQKRGRARNGRSGATHCVHGHEFTIENTRVTRRGSRDCRTCARLRAYRNYHRQEAS